MIDVDSGYAAFAVVGGSGRISGDRAVPLQALRWTGDDMALLRVDASALEVATGILDEEPVARRSLAELYQRYGARPYWETGGNGGR